MEKTISRNPSFDFSSLSTEAIQALLQTYRIALSPEEVIQIQHNILKRPPTLAECVLWGIQGSEHCSYKSSRLHLSKLPTQAPNVILGPKEDAGVIAIACDNTGKQYGLVISHESHNHPAQLVPFEGAATGVGGNVRDVCCMGAEVIALIDSLRFGEIDRAQTKRIHHGVVSGIAHYGNAIGVPNLGGDSAYHSGYNHNCLVTVVTLGIVRADHLIHSYAPEKAVGYSLILVGKPTDQSGFGGASFASTDLVDNSLEKNRGAIQEPNPFLERHLLKANYALFEWLQSENLIDRVGFKDLGAGGIACASVELADSAEGQHYGADIHLEMIPTAYTLDNTVTLCAETQERFMWVAPPELAPHILKHYNQDYALPQISEGACAAVIGKITKTGLYRVYDKEDLLICAKTSDITKGIIYDRPYEYVTTQLKEPSLSVNLTSEKITKTCYDILAHPNVASRQAIYEQYDKQVQGRTYIEAGFHDAGLLQPFNSDDYPSEIRETGIAISIDHNPFYGQIDAYWGAVNAVVEAALNVACTGASPQAITDCLCFGDPTEATEMGAFVASIDGICDACQGLTLLEHPNSPLPVISGNVSLYNHTVHHGTIPPSPIISCVGVLENVNRAIKRSISEANQSLFLIGERLNQCGGSIWYQLHGELGANLPKPNLDIIRTLIDFLHTAAKNDYLAACHDISEGGLITTLAEMSFDYAIGSTIEIKTDLPLMTFLATESKGVVIAVQEGQLANVTALLNQKSLQAIKLGHSIDAPQIRINDSVILDIPTLKQAWQNGLRNKL